MKYYCNEDARNLVEIEIANRKEALKLYDAIIDIVKKFDGKILNKRFETALKKVDERLTFDRSFSSFSIKMNTFNNRSCKSVKTDSYGYSCTNYISSFDLTLNSYLPTYSYNPDEKVLLREEKIISSALIDALNDGKKHMEETISRLEESLNKIDEWKEKLNNLKAEMEKVTSEIPYLIKEYYSINYRVVNN